MSFDVVVVGAGVNGLVAAAYLSRAGLKTLVCERHDRVGGCAATGEMAPGVRGPLLAHRGCLDAAVIRELDLDRHGLAVLHSAARACAVAHDGRALIVWNDVGRTEREIRTFSTADSTRYPAFVSSLTATTQVLAELFSTPPPDIESPSLSDLFSLFQTSRRFRALGRTDAYRLLRWMPMPVADFAAEWFESEPLRAVIAADGVFGSFLGPRSAGSTAVLLTLASRDRQPIASGWTTRGGPGTMADSVASAARAAGATVRTNTSVARIVVDHDGARGVVLESGEEIRARAVISALDPKRTLLTLVDPVHLDPTFRHHAAQIRVRGVLTKINYVVSGVPSLTALRGRSSDEQNAALASAVRLSGEMNDIERAFDAAKYGGIAEKPAIELTVPTVIDDSLAPPGQHVVSVYAQFTPYELRETTWEHERERLGDLVTRLIDEHAPGFASSVIGRQVLTPIDLERNWGLTGGHIFHGEFALDQLFLARPLLGWARYRTPVSNLFLCGSGTHPGIGIDGRSGRRAAQEIVKALRRTTAKGV